MTRCLLDKFPVELIHQIFNYFSTLEILLTFSDVSSYLDAVLHGYSSYKVNFKSIDRNNFDLICQRILPEQVISLTLSDDQETPGQVELFLSHFQIQQFTGLRSLTLIDLGPTWWIPILSNLTQLRSLRSMIYIIPAKTYSWVSSLSCDELTALDGHLSEASAPIFSQLNQLRLAHGDYLKSTPLPCLRHLILDRCVSDTLKYLGNTAPQLKSLNIKLECSSTDEEFFYPFHQLYRLTMRVTGRLVSMNDMEQLLSKLPHLKHLELSATVHHDLIDGERLQKLTKQLTTFNPNFRTRSYWTSLTLDSFRTPFWLENKHWYVACTNGHFVSVPHFAEKEVDEDFKPPIYTTAPDTTLFYAAINQLKMSNSAVISTPHSSTLNSFSLQTSLQKIIDQSPIKHLIVSSRVTEFEIQCVLKGLPYLQQLSIEGSLRGFIEKIRHKSLEQIRILDIEDAFEDDDLIRDDLECIFPSIERLRVSSQCSTTKTLYFVERFKHLSSAEFHSFHDFTDENERQTWQANFRSVCRIVRQLQNYTFTFRFSKTAIHMWIGRQASQ